MFKKFNLVSEKSLVLFCDLYSDELTEAALNIANTVLVQML